MRFAHKPVVLVVFVMDVAVFVFEREVIMAVLMALGEVQPKPKPH